MSASRLLVAALLLGVAVVIALVLRRRTRLDAPTQPSFVAPAQIDREDFDGVDRPWLVAVFSSATCGSCADVVSKATVLASRDVAVQVVEVAAHPEMHRRYGIEAVPITVVADRDGLVHASFVGPMTATDLWAAVAEARSPGSTPEPDLGRRGDEPPGVSPRS